MRLYHGSDVAVSHPLISFNDGFADLGRGFYLTDDRDVARRRAESRARKTGGIAVVSVFEFDDSELPWVSWGSTGLPETSGINAPFGLRFDTDPAGLAAWAEYIKACRAGRTELPGLGSPAIVRAWIATEEIEMVYAGLVTAQELANAIDPAELIVQYCFADQEAIDCRLTYVEAKSL